MLSKNSICLGLFLAMLDTSVVATSLYSIAAEFDALDAINWVALSYTLTYLSFAVLFARISDVIGRKATFMIAFVIFIAFSIGCGFANSMNQLIVCRALQGLGGSGKYSLSSKCRSPITDVG
jgi:MFS family permease